MVPGDLSNWRMLFVGVSEVSLRSFGSSPSSSSRTRIGRSSASSARGRLQGTARDFSKWVSSERSLDSGLKGRPFRLSVALRESFAMKVAKVLCKSSLLKGRFTI